MGKALKDGYRKRAFVMTKIDGRSREDAARQLDESMRRLQVDYLDLVQHHEVIRYEDADRIFGTKIRTFTCIPLKSRPSRGSGSIPSKCLSMSWTRTSAVSKSLFFQVSFSRLSASWV